MDIHSRLLSAYSNDGCENVVSFITDEFVAYGAAIVEHHRDNSLKFQANDRPHLIGRL